MRLLIPILCKATHQFTVISWPSTTQLKVDRFYLGGTGFDSGDVGDDSEGMEDYVYGTLSNYT